MKFFQPDKHPSLREFVPLMALTTALDALAIDSLLPALPALGHDLGVTGNDAQLVVAAIFLGIGLGQIAGAPLSDSYGRRPPFIAGLFLFLLGSLLGLAAPDFPVMLAARIVQGFGAAVPVSVMAALVRDQYDGAAMARIMSFIGAVFILVPMVAPLMGQGILLVAPWRAIFGLYILLAIVAILWFAARQPETLVTGHRRALSIANLAGAAVEVACNPVARGYMLAGACLFAPFLGYLSSAQQIFQDGYGAGRLFALLFSTLSFAIGTALYLNGRFVERTGMQWLTYRAVIVLIAGAAVFLPVAWSYGGLPPLLVTMIYLIVTFLCMGVLFGNLNSLAMEPLGHVAGMGAAMNGFVQTAIGLPAGALIGRAFNGTVLPLAAGFGAFGVLGLCLMWAAERARRRSATP